MNRKIALLFACFFSTISFALPTSCPPATPTNSPTFCSSFQIAAECYCSQSLPHGMCANMGTLYNRMISMFATLQRACEFQHNTSTQTCIDDWNCYRLGGKDSQGQLCSSTGNAC